MALILSVLLVASLTGCTKPLEGITLNLSELVLELDETGELVVLFDPEDATAKAVEWESSNPNVATVKDGIVTPVAPGEAIIQVLAKEGQMVSICVVRVKEPYIRVSEIHLNTDTMALGLDETNNLQAVVSPENATDQGITWVSSDASIAAVNDDGEITAVGSGIAVITVSVNDGVTALVFLGATKISSGQKSIIQNGFSGGSFYCADGKLFYWYDDSFRVFYVD